MTRWRRSRRHWKFASQDRLLSSDVVLVDELQLPSHTVTSFVAKTEILW